MVQKEDTTHASGDVGELMFAVRNDTEAALAGTDGDYAPLQTDAAGRLRTTPHAAATWTETTTADNAAATATHALAAGQSHYVTSISGSFLAAAINLMTLKDGVTTIGNFHVHNQREIPFVPPLKITAGAAVELELGASGGAGNIGAVTMAGYTI